jgi:hypothetical protein
MENLGAILDTSPVQTLREETHLYCAHAALPHLLQAAQDGPRQVAGMVNISSVAGRVSLVEPGATATELAGQ